MNKKKLLVIGFVLFSFLVNSQNNFKKCSLGDLLTSLIGENKFKVITKLALEDNIKEDDVVEFRGVFQDYWSKEDYIENDSVLKGSLFYKIIDSSCFKGKNPNFYLRFVDNRLYKIEMSTTFKKESFKTCLNNYNSLVSSFKKHFPFIVPFITTKIINDNGEQQVGEGFWMYKSLEDYTSQENNSKKIDNLSIKYALDYELNLIGKNLYNTEEYDYRIEIQYTNLNGTKLTRQGY